MKKIILFAFLSFISGDGYSQSIHKEIEIEPYIRFDKYPQFTNRINNISQYDLQIKGNSWGLSVAYKIPLLKNLLAKIGTGYYRYSFNEIVSKNRIFGEGDKRILYYPSTLDQIFSTDKYWYNTMIIMLGLDKQFTINKNMQVVTGINVNNYFTFSQYYHLPYDNSFTPQPELQIKNDYKKYDKRYFGLSFGLHVEVLKKINKVSIGPSIIIPVFDLWKQDDIFPTETSTNNRQKGFNGIGVGISFNYPLKK